MYAFDISKSFMPAVFTLIPLMKGTSMSSLRYDVSHELQEEDEFSHSRSDKHEF